MNHWHRKEKLFDNQIITIGDASKIIRWGSYSFCNLSILSNKDESYSILFKNDVDSDWLEFDKIDVQKDNHLQYRFSQICGTFFRLRKILGENSEADIFLELKN